ncbi:MAG TPA: hypothetical protein VF373_14300 [Prolixibacteraceae bacterium]
MKIKFIAGLMISIIFWSCSPNEKQHRKIEGAWSLVYYQSIAKDSVVGRYIGKDVIGSQIKVWSNDHFVFVGRFKVGSREADNYGGGTYTLEGSQYIETILYHINKQWIGTKPKMLIEIKGDTLYQT